jgi:hypothetical protein
MNIYLQIASVVFTSLVGQPAINTQGPPVLPASCPPLQLHGALKGFSQLELTNAEASVSYDTLNCRIDAIYTAPVSDSPEGIVHTTTTYFSVPYWPTDVTVLSPGQWVVSGKSKKTNDAIIELWIFENGGAVQPPPIPAQPVTTPWVFSPRSSVKELYRDSANGLVEEVLPNLGSESTAFVIFYPTHDIHEISLDTGSTTKRASATVSTAGVLVVPELAERWDSYWCGEHNSRGNVYVFKKWGAGFALTGPVLVILDPAENGTLSASQLVTATQWTTGDWASAANYSRIR